MPSGPWPNATYVESPSAVRLKSVGDPSALSCYGDTYLEARRDSACVTVLGYVSLFTFGAVGFEIIVGGGACLRSRLRTARER